VCTIFKERTIPTKLPRVTISIQPETKALLDQLALLSGQPASTFVSELLNEAGPTLFAPIIEALKLAKDKKTEAWDVLNHTLAKTQNAVSQLSLAIHEEKSKGRKRAKKE
jgi:uncharacterized protein (DUF1778 family)